MRPRKESEGPPFRSAKTKPVVSATGVIAGEESIELVAVGVVLISCACILFVSHRPTGNVTSKPEVAQQPVDVTPNWRNTL